MRSYLVIGLYIDDEPVVAGVVEGDGSMVDNDPWDGPQRWAEVVEAADPAAAEAVAIATMNEYNEDMRA